ncbi:hypothetical protein B0T11DRAFT_297968 [Plectosphaerella cucumerina]|uniref:FAD/NAD(P)-binding domain-containing protein n=1 Tax=Plectosphaerella cucumerina TaxID=40658 RepID=A0A8K0TJD6_9PEZI|nr:hypothetical protein B0T11DRAFT_297968 [Plectosphaerella cucumerina]
MTANSASTNGTKTISADFIIVGGGFGGCYALYKLRQAGYSAKLLEAGSDFGGVWHFNAYPGARVDTEVPIYQLSVRDAWRDFQFTERFPDHVKLREYFAQMVEKLDLRKDTIFNSRVVEAQVDPSSGHWTLLTENGIKTSSQYVIFATGTTNKAYIPDFAGLDQFQGTVLHPCRWPSSLDIKGKRVGIIGQGASGLQILQEMAKEDAELTVFVRTPPAALPMRQRQLSALEVEQEKAQYGMQFQQAKYKSESAYAHDGPATGFDKTTPEERERLYNELWTRGGYTILTMTYVEHTYDKTANADLYNYWVKTVRARMRDPEKRDIMAPLKQFQWMGTKRPNLEVDYYEMIDRPNVKLVSLKEHEIRTFTPTGIVTAGPAGETTHDLDIVIMATGYDSVTGSLYDMNIKGKDGVVLQESWAGSIQTYLGMMAPGLPNAFMLYGPQAPSGLVSGPAFLELQVDWIDKFLSMMRESKKERFEVKPAVAKSYVQRNLDIYDRSLSKETPSWWNGSNIPGKTREPLFWVGGLQSWRRETEDALKDLERFELR